MNNYVEGIDVYRMKYIYDHIERCLQNGDSFSFMDMGNGEFSTLYTGNLSPMRSITQGIPVERYGKLEKIFIDSCNRSDYVSCLGVWFVDGLLFDKRIKATSIYRKWEESYERFGITNTNYCNPEISYLCFLEGEFNLWNLIDDEQICVLTPHVEIADKMNCGIIEIPEQTTRQQYKKDMEIPLCGYWFMDEYESIKAEIEIEIKNYDIFLVAAGYLGKGLSMWIKDCGGIAVDVGKVIDTWNTGNMGRLTEWMVLNDDLSFGLTEAGKRYEGKF